MDWSIDVWTHFQDKFITNIKFFLKMFSFSPAIYDKAISVIVDTPPPFFPPKPYAKVLYHMHIFYIIVRSDVKSFHKQMYFVSFKLNKKKLFFIPIAVYL